VGKKRDEKRRGEGSRKEGEKYMTPILQPSRGQGEGNHTSTSGRVVGNKKERGNKKGGRKRRLGLVTGFLLRG